MGKTTLARTLADAHKGAVYLNFDADRDRPIILRQLWDRKAALVILDEVHKMKSWKRRLKGVYDTEGIPPRILVTGSSRLDLHRRGSDSMAGRYHLHRLNPLSVRELRGSGSPLEILEGLNRFGGFPEPYLEASEGSAARWRKQHFERILREDIQDLEPIKELSSLLLLVDLLREWVGSPLSFAALARDLEVSPHTIKRWVQILEHMYVIFLVRPWHRNVARSILKEPKAYFYDTGAVKNDPGIRLENTVAVCLRKRLQYMEDTQGSDGSLHYIRDKQRREVDFAIAEGGSLRQLVEVKHSDPAPSPALIHFSGKFPSVECTQIVQRLTRAETHARVHVQQAAEWLDALEI